MNADRVDEDDPEFCPHFGDGTRKTFCPACNGAEAVQRRIDAAATAQDGTLVSSMRASRYSFHCAVCREILPPGSWMGTRADGRRVCTDCAPTGPRGIVTV